MSALFYMPPISAGVYPTDGFLSDAVLGGNLPLAHSCGQEFPNLAHLRFSEDRSSRSLAPRRNMKSSADAVLSVLSVAAPLQIAHRIIELVTVFVIDAWEAVRIVDESHRNQTVNARCQAAPIPFYSHRQISCRGEGGAEHLTPYPSRKGTDDPGLTCARRYRSIKRAHPPKTGCLIASLKAGYIAPFLACNREFFNIIHRKHSITQPLLLQQKGGQLCLF